MRYQTSPDCKVIDPAVFWDMAYDSENYYPEKTTVYRNGYGFGFDHLSFIVGDKVYNLVAYHYYYDNGYLANSEFVAWVSYDIDHFEITHDQFYAVLSIDRAEYSLQSSNSGLYTLVRYLGLEYSHKIPVIYDNSHRYHCTKLS